MSLKIQLVEGVLAGYAAGVFTPSVTRRLKSLFVKEADVVKAKVQADVKTVEADVAKKL